MPYVPRTLTQIRNQILDAIKSKTELTDTSESSVLFGIISAVAEEMEWLELEVQRLRDSYDYDTASGTTLDYRVQELPAKSYTRFSGSSAAGAVMELQRTDASDPGLPARTINAGVLFSRSDNPAITYMLTSSVTFEDGKTTYPGSSAQVHAPIKCTIPGLVGNADSNVITKIKSDSSGVLTLVTNPIPLGGGRGEETDEQLRVRAKTWLNSLARAQRTALINFALDFQTSTSAGASTFQAVAIFEDPVVPGKVELVVDDGTGELPTVADVAPDYGSIPLNMNPILNHKFPLTAEVQTLFKYVKAGTPFDPAIHLTDASFADASMWNPIHIVENPGAWVSQHERGVLILRKILKEFGALANEFQPGDVWAIKYSNTSDGTQLLGDPVAGLQKAIEGVIDPSLDFPGYRAAGIRVVVSAPEAVRYPFVAQLTFETGALIPTVVETVKTRIVNFCSKLGPGETLYLSRLISDLIENITGLKAVKFIPNAAGDAVTGDAFPGSPRKVIRAGIVTVT